VPYALIPDGYSLKKVTKLQKEAVNAHRRHENAMIILENRTTPIVLGAGLAVAALLIGGEELKEFVEKIPKDYESLVKSYSDFVSPKPEKELGGVGGR